ncbi:MAG TPA: hypothetical protein VL136_04420 [Candidatus Babeliales bacterium]|jgi:hypothetical protein|nr:hypothetical protein [Candidatus Babeliales bacterium]
MRSMRFSIGANVVALFLMGLTLNAGDQSGRGSSTPEVAAVTHAVQEFMAAVAKDVSAQGPHAWRKYLSQEHAFFMASNGQLVFESGEAAEQGIRALEQSIDHISLQWGQNLHVDPLSDTLAQVGVPFHETLVEKKGKQVSVDGYFTGLAQHNDAGWQFRSAHWSVPPAATVQH